MSGDSQIIHSIFADDNSIPTTFNKAEWQFLTDVNNLQYANNNVTFYTSNLKQQLVDYHNAFVVIPIKYTGMIGTSEYALRQYHVAAMKQSVLSLISGIQVTTDSGQVIINEGSNAHVMNNLRLLIEKNLEWVQTEGSEIQFHHDTSDKLERRRLLRHRWYDLNTQIETVAQSGTSQPSMGLNPWDIREAGNASSTGTGVEYADANKTVRRTYKTSQKLAVNGTSLGSEEYDSGTGLDFYPWLASIDNVQNGTFNAGFEARSKTLARESAGDTSRNTKEPMGPFTFEARIPLQLLHDFFMQLNFPLINLGFNITLYFNPNAFNIANETYQPSQFFEDHWKSIRTARRTVAGATPDAATMQNQYPVHPSLADGTVILPTTANSAVYVNTNDVRFNDLTIKSQDRALEVTRESLSSAVPGNLNVGLGELNLSTATPTSYLGVGADYSSVTPYVKWEIDTSKGGCRLYYRSIRLEPKDNRLLSEKLMSGYTRTFNFITTDYATGPPISGSADTSFTTVIQQGVVYPMRVWALFWPEGHGPNTRTNRLGSLQNCKIRNANIMINNSPYFKSPIDSSWDWWMQLREQFNPEKGSVLNWDSFRRFQHFHCFDISRLADRLASPTEPCNLTVTMQRKVENGKTAKTVNPQDDPDYLSTSSDVRWDYMFATERLNQIKFHMNASNVTIVVGSVGAV
jgi:hypothetical protein